LNLNGLTRGTAGVRAIFVVEGNVTIGGTNDAFVMTSGSVSDNAASGPRVINGGIACSTININTNAYTINWDSYFYDTAGASKMYKIPGAW
jgi:hypothetical protein